MNKKILIVEDEIGTQESYRMILKDLYELAFANSAEAGLKAFKTQVVDLVILDVCLPDRDGISLMKEIHGLGGVMPIIMVTADKDVQTAVQAMKLGASDYLVKPFNVDELKVVIEKNLHAKYLQEEVSHLRSEVQQRYGFDSIIGKSSKMQSLFRSISKVLDNPSTVLITGESGTGKELVARAIHYNGIRAKGPFVALHTAAISEKLLESELFGHEKGAFTDAIKTKKGMFELAHKGTLFLDEIGEMDPSMQVKLLRVLQEREVRRVGGTEVIPVDTRVIAATNRNLWEEVQNGHFREDLYYRLSVIPIELPPLRDKKEDIPILAHHFLHQFKEKLSTPVESFSDEVLRALEAYSWPGNIRELQNVIERLLVVSDGKEITLSQLPQSMFHPERGAHHNHTPSPLSNDLGDLSLDDRLAYYEKQILEDALRQTNYVQTKAAELLKTTRRIIKYKMDRYGLNELKGEN